MVMKNISSRVVSWRWGSTLVLLLVASRTPLVACPYSIRDSAFIAGTASSSYQLRILVKGDGAEGSSATTDKITEWLSVGASAWLADANVEARVLDVSDPGARDTLPEGFVIPPELPAAILVSPRGAATRLPGIAPGKVSLDTVMTTALGIVESPLRKDIQKRLATAWCVGLLVEGTDEAENARARRAFEVAARSITGQSTEMGKVVTPGPELLRVSHQSAEESILLWSLDLESTGEEKVAARVVLLVGRGERRGPVLQGDGVTSKELLEMFTMLGRSCSCTTDETWLSGPSLPLEWGEEIEALVKTELGFDPRNPEALGAIRGVHDGVAAASPFSDAALGYSEMSLDPGLEDVPARDSVTESFEVDTSRSTAGSSVARDDHRVDAPDSRNEMHPAAGNGVSSTTERESSSDDASSGSFRAGHVALLTLSGLALLVLAGATLIVLRARSE